MSGENLDAKTLESSPSPANPAPTSGAPPEAPPPAPAPAPEPAKEAAPVPPAGNGGGKPPVPDPVQEAISRLARPEPAKPAEKPAEPTPKAKDAPAPEAPEAKPVPEKLADDPYDGWLDERTKNLLKPQTRERIELLHRRWREAEAKAEKASANGQAQPSEWDQLVEKEGLQEDREYVPPEHLAGLVRLQAAVNRGVLAMQQGRAPGDDALTAAKHLSTVSQALLKNFGVAPEAPPEAAVEPFKGDLPEDLAELISVYGQNEADVRLLAAIKAKRAAPAPQPRAPQPSQEAPEAPRPKGVDLEALEARRGLAEIVKDGVQASQYAAYQQVLNPIMARYVQEMYPGIDPGQVPSVFNALSARDRTDMFIRAHREHRGKASNPPPQKPPAPTRTSPSATGAPRPAAPGEKDLDPVSSAIAFLSRREAVE